MATKKITALTAATSRDDDDLLAIVENPGGAPVTKKITVGSFLTGRAVARYTTNAGQTIVNAAAAAVVDFEDVDYDPLSLVTTGAAWKFTAATSGYYVVTASIQFAASTGWVDGERAQLSLYRDGALVSYLRESMTHGTGTSVTLNIGGTDIVYCAATSYLQIKLYQNSGGNLALTTTSQFNRVSIARISG